MMSEQMRVSLKKLIVGHEGRKKFPYLDTKGNVTFGIGYNATARGMTDNWIDNQYDEDVAYFYNQLVEDFAWYRELDEPRQMALIDMCFMGYQKFLKFNKMLDAFEAKDYETASKEIADSLWATEVKGRATDIERIVLTGKL